jgi:hypothetical protein
MLPAMTGLLADLKLLANRFDRDALVEVRFGLIELPLDLSRCVCHFLFLYRLGVVRPPISWRN